MDPIEKVFRDLPSPAADQAALDQHGVWEQHSVWAQFFSKDQDYEVLRSGLGRFALDKPQIRDDGSAKSQQLKYHAWISRGRKDEEYPFKDKKCPEEQRFGVPEGGHAFLPDKLTDSKFCDHCGKPDAEEACSGCLVKLDSHVVMKTAYCNKACQTQDWKEHKFVCMGRRKVCRAVSIIYDLFVMFQKKVWINKRVVGIAEKQGITYITHDESDEWAFQGKPVVRDFPSDLAPSEEHALAALLNGECQQLLCICQGLIKLILMPLCQSLHEVQIMPRNAHRPTCHIRHGQAHNTMYSQHTLLCAMLKSDELMAIDIAGAQVSFAGCPFSRVAITALIIRSPAQIPKDIIANAALWIVRLA
ncbi:hypothetical protein NUW58_g9142 [Xylaria curta]|uniref:Uncharacterized protein n=1 Tax=Xylaria curta TaxID=42375 RepID=A0ACC1N2H1_9PEZI|nr:hypothetical protein NUW58_g9142 [Xylaria curta]